MSVFLEAAWYGMVIWVILLGMADVVWSLLVYVTEGAIGSTLTTIAAEGEGIWLPSSGDPCPSQCLDLTMFAFISSELQVRLQVVTVRVPVQGSACWLAWHACYG